MLFTTVAVSVRSLEAAAQEVTCAGQIKVWPSKRCSRGKWEGKFLRIKKDVMELCFGVFPPVDEEVNGSGTVLSKTFWVLDEKKKALTDAETAVPPPDALLRMQCISARANKECENTEKERGEDEKETLIKKKDLRSLMEEEKNVNMVVINYDTNYYKLSADISKETWIVGGTQDPLFRSRSWKR